MNEWMTAHRGEHLRLSSKGYFLFLFIWNLTEIPQFLFLLFGLVYASPIILLSDGEQRTYQPRHEYSIPLSSTSESKLISGRHNRIKASMIFVILLTYVFTKLGSNFFDLKLATTSLEELKLRKMINFLLGPVEQRVDNNIQRINPYQVDEKLLVVQSELRTPQL